MPLLKLLVLLLPLLAPLRAEEDIAIQRYLAYLYLGDSLEDIQRVYPPAQEWPSYVEPRGKVTRLRVERGLAKSFPKNVDVMWLGMKKDRLVEIQLLYNASFSRGKSPEAWASDLSLDYGEPKRNDTKFWWTDGKTVLRVFYANVPVIKDGREGVELRTSIQVMEHGLFQRVD